MHMTATHVGLCGYNDNVIVVMTCVAGERAASGAGE